MAGVAACYDRSITAHVAAPSVKAKVRVALFIRLPPSSLRAELWLPGDLHGNAAADDWITGIARM